jgi:hypothetical protein
VDCDDVRPLEQLVALDQLDAETGSTLRVAIPAQGDRLYSEAGRQLCRVRADRAQAEQLERLALELERGSMLTGALPHPAVAQRDRADDGRAACRLRMVMYASGVLASCQGDIPDVPG